MRPWLFVHLDKSGIITACNENLCKIVGSSQDKIIGLDTLASLKVEAMKQAISRALAGEKSQYVGEYLSITGEVKTPVRAIYSPIRSQKGMVTGVIGILEDINYQLSAEREKLELETHMRQLQKNEAIGALAGGIAHDFNNILFPILGFAEIMEDDIPDGSPLRENLNEILTSAKRAKELVKQILTFSRQTEQELKPLKPDLVIKEVIKLIRATIPSTISVKQKIDPGSRMLMADPTQVHQIAMNLITNAYHAMADKGGILTVKLENLDSEECPARFKLYAGPHILLSVEDTGIGMDPATMEKIFDPYFTTKPTDKGTGLGLSVVQGIVANYGGHIDVQSTRGKGTVFHVYLPAVESNVETDPTLERVQEPRGNEMVLLVDDEAPILRMEQQMLERLGYKVNVIEDSRAALAELLEHSKRYDLLITDMTMPRLTGDNLIKEARKAIPNLPAIICTGFSEKLTPERASSIGANAVLTKPVIKSKLAITVRKVLDGQPL